MSMTVAQTADPADPVTSDPRPGVLTRVSLVAAPALFLAAHLVQATPDAHDTASELSSIAAAPDRYQWAGALGFAGLVLYLPALLGLAALVRRGRRRVAGVGLAMSVTGLLALTSLMGSAPVALAMARSADRGAMVEVTDAYESLPITIGWVLLLLVGWSLGPLVLGFGLWRAGGSIAVPVLLTAGFVAQLLDAGRWPLAAGFALTTAGFAVAAVTGYRTGRRDEPLATMEA